MTKNDLEYYALEQLEKNPKITQRQLACALGVSVGKANYLVRALVDVGWLKLGNFTRSNNKLGYVYLLTPKGVSEKALIAQRFLERKRVEYEKLNTEIQMLEQALSKHQS